MNEEKLLGYAKETLLIEISEAQRMLDRLDTSIVLACQILLNCNGKVIVSGIGKSGHIAKKIAASLASTGTPAFFMHLADAVHGDLGMISVQDVVIFISYSGQARELNIIIPVLTASYIPIIAVTGDCLSPLARAANCVLDIKIEREACPMELVPTSSIINALMMGDALTMMLMREKGFNVENFARVHPGGSLGVQLHNCVRHIMRTGVNIAKVSYECTVMDAMFELSRTGLGLTVIYDNLNHVIGIFTDRDLKRWLLNGQSLSDPIVQAMSRPILLLKEECCVFSAVRDLSQKKITTVPVINLEEALVGVFTTTDIHNISY